MPELEDADGFLAVVVRLDGVLVIPELGGILFGVYLIPLSSVQLVSLAVALPVTAE